VKFVTVIWGRAYIQRFAELALPSYLAPGNLPALAAATELETVFMTLQRDAETFQRHAAFQRLRDICAVRFVAIDDLVTSGVYGVTLTLAYARAVIGCGADMTNTHFVFMNADFVLADGSLRGLLKYILAGRSIMLAPSLRAIAEEVEAVLLDAVDPVTHTLAMPPREMVALALRHLHPTVVAKTMGQSVCHSTRPNQFYWWVDEHTLLARYFLAFMLCLKPERVVTSVNSYCDYGFIPEMCPSGNEVMLGDSDEFFVLELQQRDQEKFLLRPGSQHERSITRDLARWTTAEHRRAAGYDVVFHARDIPREIERAKAEASAFVERLLARLPRPKPHVFHHFWIAGVLWFRHFRRLEGWHELPPELEWGVPSSRHATGVRIRFVAQVARRAIGLLRDWFSIVFGSIPRVTRLHPRWPDYQLLRRAIEEITEHGGKLFIVTNSPRLIEPLLPTTSRSKYPLIELGRAQQHAIKIGTHHKGDRHHILIHLRDTDLHKASELVEGYLRTLSKEDTLRLFVQFEDNRTWHGVTKKETHFLMDVAAWERKGAQLFSAGGPMSMRADRFLRAVSRTNFKARPWAFLWGLPAVIFAGLVALSCSLSRNSIRQRLPNDHGGWHHP
jgi:hypothetical protein